MDHRLTTLLAICAGLALGGVFTWVSVSVSQRKTQGTPMLPARFYRQSLSPVPAEQLGQMVFLLHPATQKTCCTRHAPSVDWYTRHGYCRVSLVCWLEAQHIDLPITYP